MIQAQEIKSPTLCKVYEYWKSKNENGRLPSRADIKLSELKALATNIFIVEALRAPLLSFRFRLIGTALVDWAERDDTGCSLTEMSPGAYERQAFQDYRSVLVSQQPRFDERVAQQWLGKWFDYYERVLMPLSNDGETVDMLLGALDIHLLRE